MGDSLGKLILYIYIYVCMYMPAWGKPLRVVVQIFLIVVCFSGVSGGGVGGGGVVNVHWTCTLT